MRVGDMAIGLILPSKGEGTGPESLDAAASAVSVLGWNSVWVTDHMMVPAGDEADEYGHILEALTALTYVGARHPHLQLGTSVLVPAMRDAPQLAKEIATIDVLLGGRLTVGVGVSDSGDLAEYTNLGKAARFTARGGYLDETIALWRHLWSGSTAPFRGEHHVLEDFTFLPLPPRGAAIPIWCGGRSARALRRTAELCDGYHAAQTGPEHLRERLPALRAAVERTGRPFPTVSVRARVKFGARPGPVYAIVGEPADMVADVAAFAEQGVDELIVVVEGSRPEQVEANIGRFHREVLEPAAALAARRVRAGSRTGARTGAG
ncbi:LLM class flavin-dependent oxidoreductase [Dactylosporangium sp. NPDC005572]|uniref:LLM class flavin-dependent oxidoreductase n=1 Tax=Dactylosporangium sp. NPDC005572 TaxID=3156889 RepID=UPI0033A86DE9